MQGGCIVVVLDYKYICNKPESKFLTGQAEGLACDVGNVWGLA